MFFYFHTHLLQLRWDVDNQSHFLSSSCVADFSEVMEMINVVQGQRRSWSSDYLSWLCVLAFVVLQTQTRKCTLKVGLFSSGSGQDTWNLPWFKVSDAGCIISIRPLMWYKSSCYKKDAWSFWPLVAFWFYWLCFGFLCGNSSFLHHLFKDAHIQYKYIQVLVSHYPTEPQVTTANTRYSSLCQ